MAYFMMPSVAQTIQHFWLQNHKQKHYKPKFIIRPTKTKLLSENIHDKISKIKQGIWQAWLI